MAKNYGDEIHKELRARANVEFPIVKYPARVRSTDPNSCCQPKTVLIGRSAATFGDATLNRRAKQLRERISDTWLMTLRFDHEVDFYAFEEDLQNNPPRVARDENNGLTRQVTLFFEEAAYRDPPRQQASSGSKATFRFSAAFTPL